MNVKELKPFAYNKVCFQQFCFIVENLVFNVHNFEIPPRILYESNSGKYEEIKKKF